MKKALVIIIKAITVFFVVLVFDVYLPLFFMFNVQDFITYIVLNGLALVASFLLIYLTLVCAEVFPEEHQ